MARIDYNKPIPNVGYVPDDDNPYLIDFPVSTTFAMNYILKGYTVPTRMIRFADSEDRRRYLCWLRGEPESENAEIMELRQEIARLREALERAQPRQQFRPPAVPMPRQSPPAKEIPITKASRAVPRVLAFEDDDD